MSIFSPACQRVADKWEKNLWTHRLYMLSKKQNKLNQTKQMTIQANNRPLMGRIDRRRNKSWELSATGSLLSKLCKALWRQCLGIRCGNSPGHFSPDTHMFFKLVFFKFILLSVFNWWCLKYSSWWISVTTYQSEYFVYRAQHHWTCADIYILNHIAFLKIVL